MNTIKFPSGFRDLTDKIKAKGIKPALWLGGKVPHAGPLFKAHPDWFADYTFRIKNAGIPDVSIPEMREYMEKALDYFIGTCGFEGIKQDFWSYPFEDSHDLLKRHDRSGYEWRKWWTEAVSLRLPEYGHHQTGCDIVMANPFLANDFTNYRYGIDIGSGHWENILTNFVWGAACFGLHIGDLFVPNSDAIGILPTLTDEEALFCINYCLISRSMVEVSGWLYQQQAHPRMKWVNKALCCPNNGQDVFFADYDYRSATGELPEVWYIKTPHFSLREGLPELPARTVGVFNLGETTKRYTISAVSLDLPDGEMVVTDVWTEDTFQTGEALSFELPPHGSRLLSVSPSVGRPLILDANIKVERVEKTADGLQVDLAYPGELVLLLAAKPAQVSLNGKPLDAQIEEGQGSWRVQATLPGDQDRYSVSIAYAYCP